MTLLDAALAEVVKARLDSLAKQVEECMESIRDPEESTSERSRGWYYGRVITLRREIRFLTDLHLTLTNTMKKPAENPNSTLQAESAA